MIITVTSYKGGVGKTTTAIHLAAYLQTLAPTLLVDGDAIRSATKWNLRSEGKGLPFKVIKSLFVMGMADQAADLGKKGHRVGRNHRGFRCAGFTF